MTSHYDRKAEIRTRMGRTGEPYIVARRAIENETVIGPAVAVTVDAGVPSEERGVGALPAQATPPQCARAAATWRVTDDPGN